MTISRTFENKGSYLLVTSKGEFTLKSACDGFLEGLNAADSYHVSKVLVDCLQLSGKPSTVDLYSYGRFMADELSKRDRRGPSGKLRLAYVAAEPLADPGRLRTLVATNRGVVTETFDNVDAALKWLAVEESGNESDATSKARG